VAQGCGARHQRAAAASRRTRTITVRRMACVDPAGGGSATGAPLPRSPGHAMTSGRHPAHVPSVTGRLRATICLGCGAIGAARHNLGPRSNARAVLTGKAAPGARMTIGRACYRSWTDCGRRYGWDMAVSRRRGHRATRRVDPRMISRSVVGSRTARARAIVDRHGAAPSPAAKRRMRPISRGRSAGPAMTAPTGFERCKALGFGEQGADAVRGLAPMSGSGAESSSRRRA